MKMPSEKLRKLQSRQRGFTIVELLIVIVVIGILAAITVVAFNGVQTRAENVKTIQAVSAYVKAAHNYASLYGAYPQTTAYPCMGALGTSCARLSGTSTTCTASGGDGGASSQAAFDTEMRKVINGSMPQPSTQSVGCGGNTYGGAYFRPSSGPTAVIVFYLKGDQPCQVSGVHSMNRMQQEDLTRCVATLVPLS